MNRRHDLDWIRICAFGILVFFHVGMYYVTWGWHVKSPHATPVLEPFMLLTAPWRMSLLFLISGTATAFMLGKSRDGFLRQRSWRLLPPLLFGMLVIVPPQSYFQVVEQLPGGYHEGYLAFWNRYLHADHSFCRDGCLILPTWNHLWFVAYLWVYTVLLWLALRIAPATIERLGRRVAASLSGVGLLLWPATLLAVARIALIDRYEQTDALLGDWYNHAQYLPMFALGYWIARDHAVWEQMRALRRPALLLALGGWAVIAGGYAIYVIVDADVPGAGAGNLLIFRRAIWGLFQWSAIVAVCGYARHWAPGDSPARRYLTDAVFPIYIVHQTIIVVLAHQLKPAELSPAIEAPLLIAATFAGSFAIYEVVRRISWLRPLFGLKRKPRPARNDTTARYGCSDSAA